MVERGRSIYSKIIKLVTVILLYFPHMSRCYVELSYDRFILRSM
jgi:hypothetical protein